MTLAETDARAVYIRTGDIQHAVKGSEIAVLQALGIAWKGGTSHIRCPYPDHGGADDWRWDARSSKAFCSCVGRRLGEKGSHSIFDVVACVEGCDFDHAKLRVAEILSRSDLLRGPGRTGTTGTTLQTPFIKTDPASLLVPPPALSDPTLPIAYLAHRLGVDRDAVPVPTTRTAGFSALGYFDPAPSPQEKPVKVGEFPCVVFEMTDAEGRIHAQRIYVETGGAGKADLGRRNNGEARDPKKSAKKLNGSDIISGLCVLWGDPYKAPHLIGAEGIETACGIAYALHDRIEAGEVVVASGITANGVEAIQPWPATERITVAADRDEAPKYPGRPASLRGGRVGRTLADKLAGKVPVSMALPGQPGQSIDWLDVLRASGPEAVRQGIDAAEIVKPMSAEPEPQGSMIDENGKEWPEPAPLHGRIPPAPAFPMEALPRVVANYAQDEAERMQCPVDMIAVPMLVTLAGMIGKDAGIRLKAKDDWTERPCLWGMLISQKGSMKSSAIKAATAPLRRIQGAHVKKDAEDKAAWLALKADADRRQKAYDAKCADLLKKDTNADLPPEPDAVRSLPPQPQRKRIVTQDATIEKIGDLMVTSRGMTLIRDELAGWLLGMSRYNGGSDRQFYLECHSGGTFSVDRVGRGEIFIPDLYVNIFGGIQPDVARKLFAVDDGSDDGFIERFGLLAYPDESADWTYVDRYPDAGLRQAYNELCDRLSESDWNSLLHADQNVIDGQAKPYVRFSREAQSLFDEWLTEHMRELSSMPEDDPIRGMFAKARGLLGRLTLVIHLSAWSGGDDNDPKTVSTASLVRALKLLVDYLIPMWRRTFSSFGCTALDDGYL